MARTELNFIRAGRRPGALALLALAGALLLLGAASSRWLAQQRAVARLQAELVRAQPVRMAAAPMAPALRQQQEMQAKLVADAVRQLNVPVTRLLKDLQAPADIRVALLAVDLNGKGDALKVSAEASSAQDMMNYVAFLGERPLLASVYLVKHEQVGSAYRFSLEAQWRQ